MYIAGLPEKTKRKKEELTKQEIHSGEEAERTSIKRVK
jgi:hypothetical protein